MTTLIRMNPFREMMSLRNSVDRMLEDALTGNEDEWRFPIQNLALDVTENEDEYIAKASMPGVNPEDVEITYNNNTLTIKGEIKEDEEISKGQVHLHERRYGSFARSITLPTSINSDKIDAQYQAGVLTLHLPKVEEAKPKRITVKAVQPKMIEGKSK